MLDSIFLAIAVKNLLRNCSKKGSFFSIVYIETINRFVFGGIYFNDRFDTFPSFKHILFMFLEKLLVMICFKISSKNVYAVSTSFEFVV